MTAPATEQAEALAPQWDAMLGDLAGLLEDVAECADDALGGGLAPVPLLHWLIDANRLIAKATRREPATP